MHFTGFKSQKLLLHASLILFAAFTCSINPAEAQYFKFPNNRKRESIDFKLVKNLMIIPLFINGKGPYNFVLDTGVGLFIITDPKLIDTLQIKSLRTIKVSGFGDGEGLRAFVTHSLNVQVGSAIAESIPTAILKKDVFELSSFAGMPIHGLIGYEFFSSFIVKISFTNSVLTFFRPDQAFILRKGSKIPLSIEEKKPFIITEIRLSNGQKINAKLIIDTGAGHPISLENYNGKPFEIPQVNIAANLGIGLNGAINGYIGRIPSIMLGRYRLQNVISSFPNYNDVGSKVSMVSRNGNMGNNILKRFDVVFDYAGEAMFIKPSSYLKEPFEHDMSGLELTSASPEFNRIIITRVEPLSPAEDLGLKKDDEILSINFKPVKDLTMQDIDNMFRSKNQRSFVLEILRFASKSRDRVIMTLERRI